jgi:hypothetical protein
MAVYVECTTLGPPCCQCEPTEISYTILRNRQTSATFFHRLIASAVGAVIASLRRAHCDCAVPARCFHQAPDGLYDRRVALWRSPILPVSNGQLLEQLLTQKRCYFLCPSQRKPLTVCRRILVSWYQECRLLGYNNPVRTSQETHYVSTTECSQLMLCKN